MNKRFLSALLAMAMVLTMLPVSAFAATGDPEVAGYGFVWNGNKAEHGTVYTKDEKLPGNGTVGEDWMGQTMYVVFKEAPTEKDVNLWFEVTVGTDVWGCAGTLAQNTTKLTKAFSFLNRNGQWEQLPDSRKTGDNTAAGLAAEDVATLKVYAPTKAWDAENPYTKADLGEAIFTRTFEIPAEGDETADLKKVVPTADLTGINAVKAPLVDHNTDPDAVIPSDELVNADSYNVEVDKANITVADKDADADPTVVTVPVTLTATDLKEHYNAAPTPTAGYWVGIGVPQVAGNGYEQVWNEVAGNADWNTAPDDEIADNGQKYDTFYFNASAENAAKKGIVSVKNGTTIVNYVITFEVTPYSEAAKYNITVDPADHGTVTTAPTEKAEAGAEVTITAIPDQGYEVGTTTVTDADNGNVTVTGNKFTMPAKAVTVTVTFKQTTPPAEKVTVTFNANGGKIDGQNTKAVEVEKGKKLSEVAAPTPVLADKVFKGWATAVDGAVVDPETEILNGAKTYYAIWADPVTTGIAAGFSWTAAEANTARNAAIAAANKTGTVDDSLDQTVWFMINESVKGNHYWFEISDGGQKVYWEGPMNYAADSTARGMIAASFLHNGQNETDEVVPAQLTVKVWKVANATEDLPDDYEPQGNPTVTENITTGTNPLKIEAVTPDVADRSVVITFNQDLLGRYVIELVKGNTVVKTTTTECVAPTPAVAKATGVKFEGIDFAAGTYKVNIYQAKATEGHVDNAIDSKDLVIADKLTVTAATGTVLNKEVSKLHGALTIADADAQNVIKVTGAANYVIGWNEFSASNAELRNGNYVALHLDAELANKISIKKNGAWLALDPDGVVVARLKDTDAANKIEVALGETTAQTTADYTIDLTGVTKKPVEIESIANKDVADGALGVRYTNKVVYLSGAVTFAAEATKVDLTLKVTVDGTAHEVPVEIVKGADNALTVADKDFYGTTLKFDVSGLFLKNEASTADPAVTAPAVSEPVFEDDAKQTAANEVKNAIAGGTNEVQKEVLNNVAAQLANSETKAPEEALSTTQKTALAAVETPGTELAKIKDAVAKVDDPTQDTTLKAEGVNLVVNVYTKIEIADIEPAASGAPTTLKLSITPMAQTVLTTVDQQTNPSAEVVVLDSKNTNKDTANAVLVKEEPAKVDVPTVVTIQLPDSYAAGTYTIQHEKNGVNYYYEGTVNASHVLTFTSLHGFSDFTIHATDPRVAQVGDEKFETLQQAVDAITGESGTIKLLKNPGTETAKVNKVVAITIDASEVAGYTVAEGLLVAGSNVEKAFDSITNKFTFTTKSTTNPGGPIGGGVSGSTTYSVNVPTTEHGTVTVNPRNASKDATVTITVSPNQGYILDTLTVTDKDGNNIELTKVDSNKYTFKMPASRVEIKASFKEGTAPADGGFTDITSGEYYYDAVLWAVDKGITTGLTETTFGPNASCTRAQMVTFLWRAAGSPEPTATTTAFTDVDSNEYYYKAMLWAVEKGITKGTTDTTFAPNATVTRAQTVTFLYRYANSPAVSGTNAFTDLEAGEYYVDAVQWAATNGITTGTSETTFSPANNCTRGQIVTFLYRHLVK